MDGVKFLYSERFSQDPVEVFFGKQRMRGRRSDNPTIDQFHSNTQAITVAKSLASGGSSSIRKRKAELSVEELSAPLRKRQQKRNVQKINN